MMSSRTNNNNNTKPTLTSCSGCGRNFAELFWKSKSNKKNNAIGKSVNAIIGSASSSKSKQRAAPQDRNCSTVNQTLVVCDRCQYATYCR